MQDRADERKRNFIQIIQKVTKGEFFIEIIFVVQYNFNIVKVY